MPIGAYQHKSSQGFRKGNKLGKKFQKGHIGYKAMLGKKMSKESKEKMAFTKVGKPSNAKGSKHPHTEEAKRKISKNNARYWLGRKPNEHPAWKGGISFEPYSMDWTETLKRAIRERDNYICQLCNQYGNVVHHIDYDKKNCNPNNLITLCVGCSSKVNFNRKFWENYFKII